MCSDGAQVKYCEPKNQGSNVSWSCPFNWSADNRHDKFSEHDFVIVIFGYTALALMQSVAI